MNSYSIEFLTPLFSRGAYEDLAEIRAASIRGQLHWWFRALGGRFPDEAKTFGAIKPQIASPLVVRVSGLPDPKTARDAPAMPHKTGNQANSKLSYPPGTTFTMHILERRHGLTNPQRQAFQRTLEAWLLCGTLGLRSTRAAGSLQWSGAPSEANEYTARVGELLQGSALNFALLDESFSSGEAARRVVSDTIGGRDDYQSHDSLARIRYPLGMIGRGGVRKTSPLRFRIVRFGRNDYRILALWDGRREVTGNSGDDLPAVIQMLGNNGKRIGALLAASPLAKP